MNYIVNYFFKIKPILEFIERNNFSKINFFIDFLSVSRGIYNSKILTSTIISENENLWFEETINFINWLKKYFEKYEPVFIIFSDEGVYSYHLKKYPEYKSNRAEIGYLTVDKTFTLDLKNSVQVLKKITFLKFYEFMEKNDDFVFIKLRDEESDIVPFVFYKNDFLETAAPETLNIILSTDKDLLQNLKFKNFIQIIRKKEKGKFITEIFNFENSIYYLVGNDRKEKLENFYKNTAEFISYFLAIGGDKSDGIPGVPKIGYKTLYSEIIKLFKNNENKIPEKINLEFFLRLPKIEKIISTNPEIKKLVLKNFELVDFEEIYKNIGEKLKREVLYIL